MCKKILEGLGGQGQIKNCSSQDENDCVYFKVSGRILKYAHEEKLSTSELICPLGTHCLKQSSTAKPHNDHKHNFYVTLTSILKSKSEYVSHSVVSDSLCPHGLACQAPLSLGFSRQEYLSGLLFPSPGNYCITSCVINVILEIP